MALAFLPARGVGSQPLFVPVVVRVDSLFPSVLLFFASPLIGPPAAGRLHECLGPCLWRLLASHACPEGLTPFWLTHRVLTWYKYSTACRDPLGKQSILRVGGTCTFNGTHLSRAGSPSFSAQSIFLPSIPFIPPPRPPPMLSGRLTRNGQSTRGTEAILLPNATCSEEQLLLPFACSSLLSVLTTPTPPPRDQRSRALNDSLLFHPEYDVQPLSRPVPCPPFHEAETAGRMCRSSPQNAVCGPPHSFPSKVLSQPSFSSGRGRPRL